MVVEPWLFSFSNATDPARPHAAHGRFLPMALCSRCSPMPRTRTITLMLENVPEVFLHLLHRSGATASSKLVRMYLGTGHAYLMHHQHGAPVPDEWVRRAGDLLACPPATSPTMTAQDGPPLRSPALGGCCAGTRYSSALNDLYRICRASSSSCSPERAPSRPRRHRRRLHPLSRCWVKSSGACCCIIPTMLVISIVVFLFIQLPRRATTPTRSLSNSMQGFGPGQFRRRRPCASDVGFSTSPSTSVRPLGLGHIG